MLRPYEVVLAYSSYGALRSMARRQRSEVEAFLFRLVRQPGIRGQFEVTAEDERTHQATSIGRWLISWWVDHGAREIRVTGIELIE